jgi:hypothetical protein
VVSQSSDRRRALGRGKALALALLLVALLVLAALSCGPPRTLTSLRQVDEHPLYVMRYYGPYSSELLLGTDLEQAVYEFVLETTMPDACTCFAGLNPDSEAIFGRNFDWYDHPALLLFTDPPQGYASVSIVDIHYLGYDTRAIPATNRVALLLAPYIPFDGLNEAGLAAGMMAVPRAEDADDPARPTIDSLRAIRVLLDHAGSTEEAISLLREYNITFHDPPIHYLISDSSGSSAIVEYVDGEMRVIVNEERWQVATNFIVSEVLPLGADSPCQRYNRAYQALSGASGSISPDEAMAILDDVSGGNTLWSAVYDMSTGEIQVALDKKYDQIHAFQLEMRDAAPR